MVSDTEFLRFQNEINALDASGQWAEAEMLSRRMLDRLDRQDPRYVITQDFLALSLMRQDRLDEALIASKEAVSLAHQQGEIELLAWALDNRAQIYCCSEDYPKALRCLQAAEDYLLAGAKIDRRLLGRLAQTRGRAYGGCGWWELAMLNLNKAVQTFDYLRLWQEWSTAIHDLAVAAFMQAESDGPDIIALMEASRWLEKARREFERSNNQPMLLHTTINELIVNGALAVAHQDTSELWSLIESFETVYRHHGTKTGLLMQRDSAQMLMNWAGGYCRVGRAWANLDVPLQRRKEVLNELTEILTLALTTAPHHAALWCELSALHRCRARHGLENTSAAVLAAKACLENAVDLLRQGAAGYVEPQLRAGWLGSINNLLEELAATAHVALKEVTPALPEVAARLVSLAQFLRARGRRDLVRNLKYLEELPELDRKKLGDLQARVRSLQWWLDWLDKTGHDSPDSPSRGLGAIPAEYKPISVPSLKPITEEIVSRYEEYKSLTVRSQVERELRECKEKWDHLIKRSGFLRAQSGQLDSGYPFDLDVLQANLAASEAVLDYYVGPSALYVGVIDRSSLKVLRLPITDLQELNSLAQKIGHLANETLSHGVANDSLAAGIRQCSNWLLPNELVALLIQLRTQRLYVVASGPLWRIPFAWLEANGMLALERWEVCVVPSACLAGRDESILSPRQTTIAVGHSGDNLPNVYSEVQKVAETMNGCFLLNADATPQHILREVLPKADVIHFACHGQCDAISPLMSSLLLEPDEQHSDGRLTLHEVLGVCLRASVVDLGACHTARSDGPTSFPESLGHAFLGAGASVVIASLWEAVDNEAMNFASDFYNMLKLNTDPYFAFHRAQLQQVTRLRLSSKYGDSTHFSDLDLAQMANFVLLSARKN